ncbi:alpha-E domain-containing protein [Rhodobacteraceae bacterium S2214]|nr:alpha-E domain-containing protein [Rhodobacteraceae bacterium S2214]
MLSRTAAGLFWMSRYVERMDFIARLLDAGRRLDALPRQEGAPLSEWTSVVIASGSSGTFPTDPEAAVAKTVSEYLIRDETNPSSIIACIEAARYNAKSVRTALTSEVWEAINQTHAELKLDLALELDRTNLSAFLDKVRARSILIGGAVAETMLRNDRHGFVQLGKWFERADSTARLLDVKYHVLLPRVSDVGGGLDYLQWLQILRAANSAGAFRQTYGRNLDAEGVVDLLVLNSDSPRSLRTALSHIYGELVALTSDQNPQQTALLQRVRSDYTALMDLTTGDVFAKGLHEWLTQFIMDTNNRAVETANAFGFGTDDVTANS